MTTLAQRIIETQQALTEAEAQANKPAQLAEQLAQLQAAQAAEQEKHQQVLAHYLEIIAPRNGQTVETLRTRRAALEQTYTKLRTQLDEFVTEVQAYEQAIRTTAQSITADQVTASWLRGERPNLDSAYTLLASLAFGPQHEELLRLASIVYSEKDLENFAYKHIRRLGVLRGRIVVEAARKIVGNLPNPQQHLETWGA